MAEDRLIQLARQLHKKTVEGKVSWEATATEGMYQCSFSEYVLQFYPRQSSGWHEDVDYFLVIIDNDDQIIERFSDVSIAGDLDDASRVAFYKMMGEMYSIARRQALGTEKAIEALLKELAD